MEIAALEQVEVIVSINSTSEEVRSRTLCQQEGGINTFPLIQLPRKSEDLNNITIQVTLNVSINSTSEEVRSWKVFPQLEKRRIVSINSTSEEVRRVGF